MEDRYLINPLNPKVPKFCSHCGSQMVKLKDKIFRINRQTGEPRSFEYPVKCERIVGFHWRRLLPSEIHDDLLVIDTPEGEYSITGKPHRTILARR